MVTPFKTPLHVNDITKHTLPHGSHFESGIINFLCAGTTALIFINYKVQPGFSQVALVSRAFLNAEVHRGSLIIAISGHHSKASLGNYIGRPSSEKIRACSDILSDALSGSHCSRVLPYPERSSCFGEFGCRSFKKHSPCTVCFIPCHVKKLACFYEP